MAASVHGEEYAQLSEQLDSEARLRAFAVTPARPARRHRRHSFRLQLSRFARGIFHEKKGHLVTRMRLEPVPETQPQRIVRFDFSEDQLSAAEIAESQLREPLPSWATARWIMVEGINPETIHVLAEVYRLHALAVEDIIDVPERVKMDVYDSTVFIAARLLSQNSHVDASEQLCFVLTASNTLITIAPRRVPAWESVQQALHHPPSRVRSNDASYLLYALLDAQIDSWYPLVQALGTDVEDLELQVLERPQLFHSDMVYNLKRELLLVHRYVAPMADVIRGLLAESHLPIESAQAASERMQAARRAPRAWGLAEATAEAQPEDAAEPSGGDQRRATGQAAASGGAEPTAGAKLCPKNHSLISPTTRVFLRDVLDHVLHLTDQVKTYQELSSSVAQMYADRVSQRMNYVMYILTVVSSVFIPLTFMAGIYGMNFKSMPELSMDYGYLYFWVTTLLVAGSILYLFRRRKFFAVVD